VGSFHLTKHTKYPQSDGIFSRKSSKETSTLEAMLVRGRTKEKNERIYSQSKSRHGKGKSKCWYCGKI
jgi:hypothetical protein